MTAAAAQGRFITLEGIEGSGKSSLARWLAEQLSQQGLTLRLTREPGGTPLAERVRQVVLARGEEPVPAAAELLLMFAARSIHVDNLIRPALARGEWLICDRFTDASRAYQGSGRGMAAHTIEALATVAHPGLQPDLTLLLDVEPALGLQRARGRGEDGDRFEDETLAFFARVRQGYLDLAIRDPQRWRVIDASQPQPLVQAQALQQVLQALAPGGITP
jgi:dTMP kinase